LYFQSALRNGGQYADRDEIHIELECQEAASAFPEFLDYLYTGLAKPDEEVEGREESLSPYELLSLLYLGDRFMVDSLVEKYRGQKFFITLKPIMHTTLAKKTLVEKGLDVEAFGFETYKQLIPLLVRFQNSPSSCLASSC